MKIIKLFIGGVVLLAGVSSGQAGITLIEDDFSSGSFSSGTKFTDSEIDGGWHKRSSNGPDWAIAGGVLTNSASVANDEKPAFLLNTVSSTDTSLTQIAVSFDYNVGAGSTLYFHSALMTGATNGSLNAGVSHSDGKYAGTQFSSGFVGGSVNLKDGTTPADDAANAIISFAGSTSGTYSNTFDISGYTGIDNITDVSHILAVFASNNNTNGGAITVDNLELSAISADEIPGTPRPSKPNFVLMLIDDLGWQDLGCYDVDTNAVYDTPYLDALATRGVRFTQAYSPAQVCAPSRAGILAGTHPARQHMTSISGGAPPEAKDPDADRMMAPYFSLRMEDDVISLPEALAPHGYFSGHSGKWHINGENNFPYPADQGFDFAKLDRGAARNMGDRTDPANFATTNAADDFQLQDINGNASTNGFAYDQMTEDALDFLAEAATTNKPFFCYYSTWLVHYPIQMRTEWLLKKYADRLGYTYPLDGTEVMTADGQINPYYGAMVETVDYYVHRLMTYLEDTDDPRWPGHKLIENTYVIFTSDNGGNEGPDTETYTDNDPLQEGKKFIDEGGTRVPFMVWGPGVPSNVVSDVVVNGLDLYPTLLSLAGIEVPERLDGLDLSDLLLNDPTDATLITNSVGEVRDSMFWHWPHGRFRSNIRKGGWKLIKNWDHVDNPDYEPYSLYQLYDTNGVRNDIEEANDLASVETTRVAELAAELDAWLAEVGASTPHYNPDYSAGTLPHQSEVPAILDAGQTNDSAWVTWETHKAEVAAVELIYTVTDESNPVRYGEWFDLEVAFTSSTGRVEVEIPEGTTHYLFNVIDTNNFLVSTSSRAYVPYVPYVNLPSQDALLIQSGTNFPTGDVLIANESGITAANKVQEDDTDSLAMGQTFTVTNGVMMSKLTLKVAEDATYGSGTHKMALWIGSYTNGTPDRSSEGTKVFEWIDFADTSITNNSFITIDFADVTFWPGTYAFQLGWPTNDAAHTANFYRSASDEYLGGELLKKEGDEAGIPISLPFSQQGTASRDVVFALQGDALGEYAVWAHSSGLDSMIVSTAPELNTVSTGDPLLRDDVGFHKHSNSVWTVTNGVIANSGTVLNDLSSEGAIAQIINLGNFTNLASSQLSLRFDYTTAEAGEEIFVHLWGYVDVSSAPTTTVMSLSAKRGRAWEQADPAMTAYNLGHAQGEFTGVAAGDDADAAASLTGATGEQVYSNTFDFSSYTNAPTTVAGYDYLVLGFARDIVTGAAVEIRNVVLQVVGGDSILSFVPQPGDDFLADPDGDQLVNLMEYALGGNPTLGDDDEILPTFGKHENESFQGLEYVYRRRRDAEARGLSYTLEMTTNLVDASWTTNGYTELPAGVIDSSFESVTNQIDTTGMTNEFIRLRVDAL